MYKPKISVCLPTYNGDRFLKESLDSIKNQTFKDFEVIISDDNSTDKTLDIIYNYKDSVDFPVFIYHHKNSSIGSNWNNTLKHSNADLIKFIFQDDILHKDCLKIMFKIFLSYPEIALVASKRKFIVNKVFNEKTNKWIEAFGDLQQNFYSKPKDLILSNKIFKREDFLEQPRNKIGEPSAVMFKKKVIDKIGFFDETLKQSLDYEYWYRIVNYYKVYILNENLVSFRIHDQQATQINSKFKIKDYEIYPKIVYDKYFWKLNMKNKKNLFFKYNYLGKVLKKAKKFVN